MGRAHRRTRYRKGSPTAMTTANAPRSLPRTVYRRAVDALPMSVRRAVRYRHVHGRFPSLVRPRTFTEKVTWRMLRDRRAVLAGTCDKLRMKEHATASATAGVRVPRTVWAGTDVRELAGVELPEHWVVKPNHRTGLVAFGSGPADVAELEAVTSGWLDPLEWTTGGEWAYRVAEPCLLVEERIGPPGADLTDYKFFVFDGAVRLVQVDVHRFTGHACRIYSPQWEELGRTRDFPAGDPVPAPSLLVPLREAAARIGAGFDFIRVDLYEHDGEIWFGELTPYPGSGLVVLDPPELDELVGSWWRLPRARRTRSTATG